MYAAIIDLCEAMWDVLKVYRVGGKFLNGTKAFYVDAKYRRDSGTRLSCKMTKSLLQIE